MKRQYRIAPPGHVQPSDEEIARFRDARRLVHAYEKAVRRPQRPLYRDPKAFFVLLVIVLLAWLFSGDHRRAGQRGPAGQDGGVQKVP
jgi:hypothetical protein